MFSVFVFHCCQLRSVFLCNLKSEAFTLKLRGNGVLVVTPGPRSSRFHSLPGWSADRRSVCWLVKLLKLEPWPGHQHHLAQAGLCFPSSGAPDTDSFLTSTSDSRRLDRGWRLARPSSSHPDSVPHASHFILDRLRGRSTPTQPVRIPPAPSPAAPLTAMDLLDVAMEGLAVFGFILFFVLWLMHFMSIIYVWVNR